MNLCFSVIGQWLEIDLYDSYIKVFLTLAAKKLGFILHLKYTTIINRKINWCTQMRILEATIFFFNSVKTLLVSALRPMFTINSLMSGTIKNKFSFYFLGLKLDLNFSSFCLVHFASGRCFYL